MKYWLLTTEYPPFYGGGISTYCYHTACMLSENGHQVTVFVNDKTVASFLIEQTAAARIIRFNPSITNSQTFLGDITNLSYAFALIVKKLIEQEGKPDMIEAQDYNGIAYFLLQHRACLSDWCSDIKILLTLHATSFLYMEYNQISLYKKPNFWIGEMERFCMQAADLVISPSAYLLKEIRERFTIRNPHVYVVPNPYTFQSPEIQEENPFILNNDLTFYGKLSPQKGAFRILEIFQKLWDKGFKQSFTMIGDQDIVFHPLKVTMGAIIKKKYRYYIQQKLLLLKNKISPAERADFLSKSSIIIIPSTVDNLPYAVIEMMALGKILIVSAQGGQAEIISDGVDGFVFDYNTPDSFEHVLQKAVQLNRIERIAISGKAIKKIKDDYNYDKIYKAKFELIQKIRGEADYPTVFPFIRPFPIKGIVSKEPVNSLLSVVVPYYNMGKYVDETIHSILNSTYSELEIIIVNDGSTDEYSIKKLEQYNAHKQIRIIHKQNAGLAETRNVGVENAKGTYLAFLDSDDTVHPTYYAKAMHILQHYSNVHFVGAWTKYFGNSKNCWPTFNPEPPLLLTHNMINSSSLVYKTHSFLAVGKNDKRFKIGLEDYESVLSLVKHGMNGVAIPEILFNYRVRNNSMIKGVNNKVRAAYYTEISTKHADLYGKFNEEINNLLKENGAPLTIDNSTLDNFPFHNVPIIGAVSRKMILFLKSNPRLKNIALIARKYLLKQ